MRKEKTVTTTKNRRGHGFLLLRTAFVLRAVPCAVAAYVLWLLVLVLVLCGPAAACAAEHLVEEAELGARLHDVGE